MIKSTFFHWFYGDANLCFIELFFSILVLFEWNVSSMMWVCNNYWYESSRSSELSNRHLKKEIVLHPICLLDVLVEIMVSVGSELVDIANYRQCLTAGWSAAVTEFMLKCTCVTMVFTIAICLGIHTPVWYAEELTSNAFRHLVSSNDQIQNLFGFFFHQIVLPNTSYENLWFKSLFQWMTRDVTLCGTDMPVNILVFIRVSTELMKWREL